MQNKPILAASFAVVLAFFASHVLASQRGDHQAGQKSYWSPDHTLRAVVIYKKPKGYGEAESVVKILSASNRLVSLRDFSSDGGGNGQTVVKGQWTPDSRFFVFSTESSGGHSPWHNPTHVYSRLRGLFFRLDGFVGPITTPAFRLRPPATLRTHTLAAGPVTVDLLQIEKKATAASKESTFD